MHGALIALTCTLGHGGVEHTPGQSSSIGVSASYEPGCEGKRCLTIYNYGQNYVKHYIDGDVTFLAWDELTMPIAATVLNETHILAQADTRDGNQFGISGPGGKGFTDLQAECHLGKRAAVKFVSGDVPTIINLDNGDVSAVNVVNLTCEPLTKYPGDVAEEEALFADAKFYGYAVDNDFECWFLGTKSGGSRVECFIQGILVFNTTRLNDGFTHSNLHSCGDIFFDDGRLFVANGDTSPGNLRAARPQDVNYMCGKLLRFPMDAINVFDVKGTIVGVGLRNPWTTAATGKDGERAIGNVGQDTSEDVFLVSTMDKANHNFGWPKYEGLLFRSAVAPYSASFSQAKIIFSDTDRAGLPRSI